jgi:hypothetical protein
VFFVELKNGLRKCIIVQVANFGFVLVVLRKVVFGELAISNVPNVIKIYQTIIKMHITSFVSKKSRG